MLAYFMLAWREGMELVASWLLARVTALERTLLVRAAHALPLDAPAAAAARRGRVAARRLAVHDAAQRLLDRRDELVPPVVGAGASAAPVGVVAAAFLVVVPLPPTFLILVGGGGGDEEHVADAAAERGDLGAARAEAERGERAGDVRDEPRAVLAAQRRPHDEPPLAVLPRVHRQLVGLRRQHQVLPRRRLLPLALRRGAQHRRRLPLQLLDVLDYLGQQRRLVRLQQHRRRRPRLNQPTTPHNTRENRRRHQSHH
jgi:hypothetical protein